MIKEFRRRSALNSNIEKHINLFRDTSSVRNVIALLVGFLFYFGEGLNNSILGPFFPTEAANNHEVSTTWIGIIAAAYDVANLLGIFILAPFIVPKTQKTFFARELFYFLSQMQYLALFVTYRRIETCSSSSVFYHG